ncbi:MAG: ABC transporter ATP-binding protein [Dehalococcoidia bacterium]
MPTPSAIKVEGLAKYYGDLLAVDHVSLNVNEGEFFGFLGPNGAGKTTTVRMLTGVIGPDEGKARILGHPAGSLRAKQETAVVPEMANAYLDLSAWTNLTLMMELYGIPVKEGKQRAEKLLQELGLSERKNDAVRGFSGGMRQRLILCMALVSDAQVLFLDEPTTALDVQSTRLIRAMLRNLKQEQKTIFLTTHNMDEANELCDRVAIINRGRIVATDRPDNLREAVTRQHLVEVVFHRPVPAESLSQLPNVDRAENTEDGVRILTADPCAVVASLMNYSEDNGLRMEDLHVVPPSLEDAFVQLTEEGVGDG